MLERVARGNCPCGKRSEGVASTSNSRRGFKFCEIWESWSRRAQMSKNGSILATQLVIDRFKRAAMATNFGYQDNDDAIQLAGLRAVDRAAKDLDRLFWS